MEDLPAEIIDNIVDKLCFADAKNARYIKVLSPHAARRLFRRLRLTHHGHDLDKQALGHNATASSVNPCSVEWLEFRNVQIVIQPLARYAETLHFYPALYRAGVLDDCRRYLTALEQWEPEPDEEDYDSEDGDDYFERTLERTNQRRDVEFKQTVAFVDSLEPTWTEKIQLQAQFQAENMAAFAVFIQSCTRLKELTIMPWDLSILRTCGDDFDTAPHGYELFYICARAMESCNRNISRLTLVGFNPADVGNAECLKIPFRGLQQLSIDFWVDQTQCLLMDRPALANFADIVNEACPTLEYLELAADDFNPTTPDAGVHSLQKMFEMKGEPLIFARLKKLVVQTMILDAPSLVRFIKIQPMLAELDLALILLFDEGNDWSWFANQLLETAIQTWRVSGIVGESGTLPAGGIPSHHHLARWNYGQNVPADIGRNWTVKQGSWEASFTRITDPAHN